MRINVSEGEGTEAAGKKRILVVANKTTPARSSFCAHGYGPAAGAAVGQRPQRVIQHADRPRRGGPHEARERAAAHGCAGVGAGVKTDARRLGWRFFRGVIGSSVG